MINQNFQNALDSLLAILVEQIYDPIKYDLRKDMSVYQFTKEFFTISLTVPRGVGKTEFIKKNAAYCDLIVVPDRNMVNHSYNDIDYDVFTKTDIMNRNFSSQFKTYQIIWVDEPRFVFDDISEDEFYRKLIKTDSNRQQTFIMLGT